MFNWLGKLIPAGNKPVPAAAGGASAVQTASASNSVAAEERKTCGNVHFSKGELDSAAACYRQAIELAPDYAEAYNNLGLVYLEQKHYAEAERHLKQAATLNPRLANAHYNLGLVKQEQDRPDEALAHYQTASEIRPDYIEAYNRLAGIYLNQGKLEASLACNRKVLALKPDLAEAHGNLGITLKALGQLDGAVASYTRALEINPDYAEAHYNLGNALRLLGQFDSAAASYAKALEIKPDYVEAYSNLGLALHALGQLDDAVANYRLALKIKPDYVAAHSNLLFCLSHSKEVDGQALFAEHCRFADQFEAPLRTHWPQHTNLRNPDRCLQVGFVSGDLRDHAVASFFEPVLAHLAGYPQLSLHAYYNHTVEDGVTRRLREHLAHWHPIAGLSDIALAQKIREDGIDILIDLSGHTDKHRLLSFARKPAPIQVSWLGYPGTTGLKAMDYYLADRYFLPPGEFDSQFTEKLAYLPATAPFLPFDGAPPVNALPALSNGYITFGSFNRTNKLSQPVIALWSQLLRALPNARIVLGAMPQAGENATLVEWFAREGIARERLSFLPKLQMKNYLALYHQVDLCLDTFPYPGSTTSWHALWMGVPTLTITMAGSTPVSRAGAVLPNHVGLEAFLAHNKTEFVEKGLHWAAQLAELAIIRGGLRVRFGQSAVGQPDIIAAALERALRAMWQRWCAGLPAESFEALGQGTGNAMREGGR